ncbi:hypothetical protein AVEN_110443-1 [Araneus ventricosus]|uniref:C2H2-type domain-containing protein n=1 Tax=Araneus ventricosus TaxID=182803 RepID=A0A4Y2KHK4_ARAVE|nr:hypothetical protein AVEN_110443-1 [Araneus ventricosus]
MSSSDFVCTICNKSFKYKSNLTRHLKTIHQDESFAGFTCIFCERKFKRKHDLQRHMVNIHELEEVDAMKIGSEKVEVEEKSVAPDETVDAMKIGSEEVELEEKSVTANDIVDAMKIGSEKVVLEEISVSGNDIVDAMTVESEEVEMEEIVMASDEIVNMTNLGSESASSVEVSAQSSRAGTSSSFGYPCLEKECSYYLKNRQELRQHLLFIHGKNFIFDELEFSNYSEFMEWKLTFEKENEIHFIKQCGIKKRKHGYLQYFYCFRSGRYRKEGQGKRASQRSRKTDSLCTAEIKAIISENGRVIVKICNTHYGHDNSVPFLQLTTAEKNKIANLLKMKIDISVILENIREDMIASEKIGRIHLSTRQDIKNIQRNFNLNVERHRNDAISVRLMIEEMADLDSENPVLGYKFQGSIPREYENFEEEDFILVYQHPLQREMLKQYGNKVVCLDSTHGTNAYNFKLITVLIVDDFGEGFPAAWCLSNREDYSALKKFFDLIDRNLGEKLNPQFFMSDDAPAFYNAWTDVFESSPHKLLCAFHFDKAVTKQLKQLISNKLKSCEVYKSLITIFSENIQQRFLEMYPNFKNDLLDDPETEKFGIYFINNYDHRLKEIAACYRLESIVNTNNHLESFHKDFKYNYLNGKSNKRLDHCLYKLIEYIKDKGHQRIIKLQRGKVSFQVRKILIRHKLSLSLNPDSVLQESDDSFIVKGERANYNVELIKENCPEVCRIRCNECSACIHKIKCSCMDSVQNNTICKHAHLVCRKYLKKDRIENISNDSSVLTNDVHIIMQSTSQKEQKSERTEVRGCIKKYRRTTYRN